MNVNVKKGEQFLYKVYKRRGIKMAMYKCSGCGRLMEEEDLFLEKDGKFYCKICALRIPLEEEMLEKPERKGGRNFLGVFLLITLPIIGFEVYGILSRKPSPPEESAVLRDSLLPPAIRADIMVRRYYQAKGSFPEAASLLDLPEGVVYYRHPEYGYVIEDETGMKITFYGPLFEDEEAEK